MTSVTDDVLSCSTAQESSSYAILAAIKPNDANDAVLAMAEWLAEQEHQELQIVSVIENAPLVSSFAAGVPAIPPFHDDEERRAIKRALRAAYERTGHSAPRLRVDVLEGPAPDTIAEIARQRDVRMVVVGKGTRGMLSHLVYGEQVMEIIRRSRCPVLVVPPTPSIPIERAMVAFDFSMASMCAALIAHEMLGPGGRLTLVHVATPRRIMGKRSQWWLRSIERRAREALGEFVRTLPPRAGVTVEMEKMHGEPVDILATYAHSQGMHLLACGWHEQALLERMFGGSNTADLLHRAECAVLVAPEPRRGRKGDGAA
jgi:nucleotide-binding universal stress UspA family protein